jgi:hypothetical protein
METYATERAATVAGKRSETANLHREIAIAHMYDGRYLVLGPADTPVYLNDADTMTYGTVVARYIWSGRTRKWRKVTYAD